jgi:hypothetical protein
MHVITPATRIMHHQQISTGATSTGGGGAFTGISAADTGRMMVVKLNNNAKPIARKLRRMGPTSVSIQLHHIGLYPPFKRL